MNAKMLEQIQKLILEDHHGEERVICSTLRSETFANDLEAEFSFQTCFKDNTGLSTVRINISSVREDAKPWPEGESK